MMRRNNGQSVFFEPLETRSLLSAVVPTSFSVTSSVLGSVLNIHGTSGDDRITVRNTSAGLQISNATGWSSYYTGALALIRAWGHGGNDRITIDAGIRIPTMLWGGAGVDTLIGGSGSDSLYGGDGRDYLYGQGGDDVLVSLGDSAVDRCYGGAGMDSFWCDTGVDELIVDLSAQESAGGAVHRVGSFMSLRVNGTTHAIPPTLLGQNLPDPSLTPYASGYTNFSSRPLFSKYGPRPDDVYQGAVGDCFLLASLGSIANTNPHVIYNTVVDLGDGTFAVQFTNGSSKSFVRVDADLPTNNVGLAYAKQGRQGSLWVAIVEKAYAFFRYNQGSYGSLDGGYMSDVYSHMGLSNSSNFNANSGTSLLQQIQADLAAGKAVSFGTNYGVGGAPVTSGHAYMVDAVITNSSGQVTGLRLRNPWGVDDTTSPANGPNDGYIIITAAQAYAAFWFTCSAVVR